MLAHCWHSKLRNVCVCCDSASCYYCCQVFAFASTRLSVTTSHRLTTWKTLDKAEEVYFLGLLQEKLLCSSTLWLDTPHSRTTESLYSCSPSPFDIGKRIFCGILNGGVISRITWPLSNQSVIITIIINDFCRLLYSSSLSPVCLHKICVERSSIRRQHVCMLLGYRVYFGSFFPDGVCLFESVWPQVQDLASFLYDRWTSHFVLAM